MLVPYERYLFKPVIMIKQENLNTQNKNNASIKFGEKWQMLLFI